MRTKTITTAKTMTPAPSAVLVSNNGPAQEDSAPSGPLVIVFTDIVKSTDIWEKATQAMVVAMELHDETIRSLTISHHGYEVKQNGDGFMLAFPSAISAVQFCLAIQESLLDEEWPKGLLKLQPGKETTDDEGQVLFRGLQLRMSAHWGEPVSKWNEVIKRMDYLGPVVNRAARFVQVTEPGQIVVSEDFVGRLHEEMGNNTEESQDTKEMTIEDNTKTTPKFRVCEMGEYEFQGLTEAEKLYYVVQKSLEGRVEHWNQVAHVSGVKGNLKSE